MEHYYSNGKLLLTGEYAVLDGAKALAVPTVFGQSLSIVPRNDSKLIWKSFNSQGQIWFECEFVKKDAKILILNEISNDTSKKLLEILQAAQALNSEFLKSDQGFNITTRLDFPKFWGLGSSSTLINNIANWAQIDAYELLEQTFGGSGYDIASAQYDSVLTYQLVKPCNQVQDKTLKKRSIQEVSFNPEFSKHLYFVYLNKKKNSQEAIQYYKANKDNTTELVSKINEITQQLIDCNDLEAFCQLMDTHEHIMSKAIHIDPIKTALFNDFKGSIKSLGAWGGDFVLVASKDDPTHYFKEKGFSTILRYSEMVLQ